MRTDKTTGSVGRKPLPHELEYVETMSKLLAEESGIKASWIKDILIKTIPHNLTVELLNSTPTPGQFLYQFRPCLFEAMKWLSKEQVIELFSGDLLQLKILEERYGSLLDEVPFVSFKELLPTAKEFQGYLEDEFQSMIDTGGPSKHFYKSYYLERTFLQTFRWRLLAIESTPESAYLERHKQFTARILSDSWLKKMLGPNFYLEFREVENKLYMLSPNFKTMFGNLVSDFHKEMSKDKSSESLLQLKKYLSDNKLKIPTTIEKRDEALRTSLHILSQDALKAFIESHRNHEQGTTLQKVWVLICSMPYEQLDLIFNGNMSYFGIVEYDIDDPSLYTHGRNLVEKILIAAALDDESIRGSFRSKFQESIGPIIEDFYDSDTGELRPITYSVYQAIDRCGHDAVTSACGELASAKMKLVDLHTSLKKRTQRALEISFDRLKEIRRQVAQIEFLRAAGASEVEGGIVVGSVGSRPTLERGFFSKDYGQYQSKNPAYPIFKFSGRTELKQKAIARLHRAYESAYPEVPITDLLDAMYGSRAFEVEKRKKNPWKLEDVLKRDPVMKYGMVRRGEPRNNRATYRLDFSFEDYSPDEQLRRIKKQKADKKNVSEIDKAEKSKLKSEKGKAPRPWDLSVVGKSKKKKPTASKLDRYSDEDDE